jgi:hypothetical protein
MKNETFQGVTYFLSFIPVLHFIIKVLTPYFSYQGAYFIPGISLMSSHLINTKLDDKSTVKLGLSNSLGLAKIYLF